MNIAASHRSYAQPYFNVCFRGFRFLIDGEAIVTNGDSLAVFDLIRHKRYGDAAVLCAFDLIELDGEDLRRSPIEYRKCKLAKLVRGPHLGIVLNEHYEGDGEIVLPSTTLCYGPSLSARSAQRAPCDRRTSHRIAEEGARERADASYDRASEVSVAGC